MKIQYRIPFFLLLGAAAATACLERIDSSASSGLNGLPGSGTGGSSVVPPRGGGGSSTASQGGSNTPRGTGGSASPQGGGGSAGGAMPDAGHVEEDAETPEPEPKPLTTSLGTPEIEFVTPEGEATTTVVPCEATVAQATTILTDNCAPCHGGRNAGERQGQPPFDYVLDFEKLLEAVSTSVPDPLAPPANRVPGPNFQGMRFLIPGDPNNSRLYFRMAHKEMPPLPIENMPDTVKSRPTVSDFSVIRQWILECVEAPPDEEPDGGAGGDDAGEGDDADPGDPGDGDAAANAPRR